MNYNKLNKYGLSKFFEEESNLYKNLFLGRIIKQHRNIYRIVTEHSELWGSVSGRFSYSTKNSMDFPVVGDWVMVDKMDNTTGNAIIHNVLPRKSIFKRKSVSNSNDTQVIATNIDTLFICMALNADFNIRRLERYLTVAFDSNATPVIVLTKSDLCDDLNQKLFEVSSVSIGTEIIVCSVIEDYGYKDLLKYIDLGKTVAFVGSSGVGKSTLINKLIDKEVFLTNEIGENDKGRHTTTHRELILLPSGGALIDTPGIRELQIDMSDLSKSFEDIESLSSKCKFNDCTHNKEPGCAVIEAIENGTITKKRFESYKKLQNEIGYEGLNSYQIEQEKIKRMFGSKKEMQSIMRSAKNKRR